MIAHPQGATHIGVHSGDFFCAGPDDNLLCWSASDGAWRATGASASELATCPGSYRPLAAMSEPKPRAWLREPKVQRLPGRHFTRGVTTIEPTAEDREIAELDGDVLLPLFDRTALDAAVAAEREKWRLRTLGLQAQYDDPACRAALKHAAAYGAQEDAAAIRAAAAMAPAPVDRAG